MPNLTKAKVEHLRVDAQVTNMKAMRDRVDAQLYMLNQKDRDSVKNWFDMNINNLLHMLEIIERRARL